MRGPADAANEREARAQAAARERQVAACPRAAALQERFLRALCEEITDDARRDRLESLVVVLGVHLSEGREIDDETEAKAAAFLREPGA